MEDEAEEGGVMKEMPTTMTILFRGHSIHSCLTSTSSFPYSFRFLGTAAPTPFVGRSAWCNTPYPILFPRP